MIIMIVILIFIIGKDKTQFCLICCDNEYGSFAPDDRIECIK